MLFVNKDYANMSSDELKNCYVHCGVPEVTERTFSEFVGRRYKDLTEITQLEHAINWVTYDNLANEHYAILLSLEYGKGLCQVLDLEPKCRDFLLHGDLATRLRKFKAVSDLILVAYTTKRCFTGELSDDIYAKKAEY